MTFNQTAFEYLTGGHPILSVQAAYYNVMQWWWVILLFLLTIFMIYLMTRSLGLVSITSLLGSVVLAQKIPGASRVMLYMIAAVSLAFVLYKMFGDKENR